MALILVADDEIGIREFLAETLEGDGHEVVQAKDGAVAAKLLDERSFDLLVTDLKMPHLGGLELLRKLAAEQPEVQVIVLTAHASVTTAVAAMKLGAFDYLEKPLPDPDALVLLAGRALERRGLLDLKAGAKRVGSGDIQLSYGDPAMAPVIDAIEKVARTSATVLLLGKSGTGKEVAARTIHELSDRKSGPFLAVNCAALTETLLESELFGHERGAFTGASERRRGRIELCDGGSFFLDEVGELKPELQAKLLRVIQERRFERVGGTQSVESNVRWIAATNRDLREDIASGRFREDLYHRLAVFPIRLPPLCERPRDLLPIAEQLLVRISGQLGRRPLKLSDAAARKIAAWHWPGNVRELANALERAAILVDGHEITAENLWLEASSERSQSAEVGSLADIEREAIARALRTVGGNRRRAAELLGIGERTLYDKIKRYDLAEGAASSPKGD